jgi:hypothetical protein
MKIDRIQQLEAISDLARSNGMVDEADTIKSQAETLKGELGIVGKGLYALVGKTNNYTSALQNQTTGAGRTGAVSGGGTVTPAATPAAAEASDRGTGAAAALSEVVEQVQQLLQVGQYLPPQDKLLHLVASQLLKDQKLRLRAKTTLLPLREEQAVPQDLVEEIKVGLSVHLKAA